MGWIFLVSAAAMLGGFGCQGSPEPQRSTEQEVSLDVDGDGQAERLVVACASFLVDADQDGTPEGIDVDCDGTIDIAIKPPAGTGATAASCASTVSVNGQSQGVACDVKNGAYACVCRVDGAVVEECTTPLGNADACTVPSAGNCCGFDGGAATGGGGAGGGGGTGGQAATSRCEASVSVNGAAKSIRCASTDGVSYSCTCGVDGAVVKQCTTPVGNAEACTLPGAGNCCGF